jgi:hypothetical protein
MVLLSFLQNLVQEYFFFTRAQGYVKALEKSTSRVLSWREVFEHCAHND